MRLEGRPFTLYAPGVDPKDLLVELLHTCKSLGLTIRDEPMKVPATRLAGGLVRLRGKAVVIIDSSAPVVDRIAAIADALCELAVDPLHLSREARRAIALARIRRRRMLQFLRSRRLDTATSWKRPRLLRPKPGLYRSPNDRSSE
ncbi:MAG TPA: hypothetical protein VIV60_21470 [Polyangiaceae bacterium]